jgi:hypothetical protein
VTKVRSSRIGTEVVRGAGSRVITMLRKRLKKPARNKRKRVVRTKAAFQYLAGLTFAAALVSWAAWQFELKDSDHSALLKAPGVVSWDALTNVAYTRHQGKTTLRFDDGIQALDGKAVKLRGYITPLNSGTDQRHFILSSRPPTCPYCLSAGVDEMVEVLCERPVKYSLDPITVFGQLEILHEDASGFFYRMVDAAPVSSND